MKKNDWYGMGVSVLLHGLLLLAFSLMSLGIAEPEPIGYIEVDFGPISEGRPVQRAEENRPETPDPKQPEPEPEVTERAAPPKDAKPVNLAKQPAEIQDEEKVHTPETEKISPVQQNNPAEVEKPEPQPEPVKPLGGGATDGDTGETQGTPGAGEQEQKTAPFQIEGLNRSTVYAPIPNYAEKVNADIKVRITVDPQGRITQIFPLLKGNPSLEKAVQEALQRWRFNALPPNVPQESQTGTITFRFRLE